MASDVGISAAARATGFSPSALRYYEQLGLVTPPRTAAGYRRYDQRLLERARFIGRAKQLGLRLDDIAELIALWDGDRCSPVAGRLGQLVREQVVAARSRAAELDATADELEQVARSLADGSPADADPCGDACSCVSASASAAVSSSAAITRALDVVPVACTLDGGAVPARIAAWSDLLATATDREVVGSSGTVRFPPGADIATRVAALAAAEQSCCAFFTFTITITPAATMLGVRAPEDAGALVAALFGDDSEQPDGVRA